MSKRLNSFLVVLLLMFPGEIFAQAVAPQITTGCSFSTMYRKNNDMKKRQLIFSAAAGRFDKKKDKILNFKQAPVNFLIPAPAIIISSSLYADRFGFICRKEWQLEKLTTVPFRFRLGSLDYVNYLEQKPNAIRSLQ